MSRLCLSAALLVLLGILVAGTREGDNSNKNDGKSQLLSPLQTGWEGKGESLEGAAEQAWSECYQPSLGFSWENGQFSLQGHFMTLKKKIIMFSA